MNGYFYSTHIVGCSDPLCTGECIERSSKDNFNFVAIKNCEDKIKKLEEKVDAILKVLEIAGGPIVTAELNHILRDIDGTEEENNEG